MPRVKKSEPEPEPASSGVKSQSKKMVPKKSEDSKPASPVKKDSKMNNQVVHESVVTDTASAVDSEPSHDSSLTEEFSSILTQVQQLTQQLSGLKNSLRVLEKKTTRELKQANKAKRKSKHAKANRQPSGFVKPTLISNELAKFLDKPVGTELARTDVTKEINQYIREHKLQDPTNGRRILADAKLKGLLALGPEDELTYFNLQKFMSPHFAKATSKPVVA